MTSNKPDSNSGKRRYRLLAYVPGRTYSGNRGVADDEVPSWPHLVVREFLLLLAVGVVLWVISLAFDAPLEEEANPGLTPNPAKAPWYFLGLQELLVYFDPWIAGVMLPLMIIFGLLAIPYLDPNRRGTGEYALGERKFAVTVFTFGIVLWFALIFVGLFLRGPNWAWYSPWEDLHVAKPTATTTRDLPMSWGILALALYSAVGLILPGIVFSNFRRQLGWTRYIITMLLLLAMFALPVKIALRLAFDIKYVLVTPWFNI